MVIFEEFWIFLMVGVISGEPVSKSHPFQAQNDVFGRDFEIIHPAQARFQSGYEPKTGPRQVSHIPSSQAHINTTILTYRRPPLALNQTPHQSQKFYPSVRNTMKSEVPKTSPLPTLIPPQILQRHIENERISAPSPPTLLVPRTLVGSQPSTSYQEAKISLQEGLRELREPKRPSSSLSPVLREEEYYPPAIKPPGVGSRPSGSNSEFENNREMENQEYGLTMRPEYEKNPEDRNKEPVPTSSGRDASPYYYPPRKPLPLPGCFYNPTGYVCCNRLLNDMIVDIYTNLEAHPKFHVCNINVLARKLQQGLERGFNHTFETIVSFEDFAQKIHFNEDLVCKVEIAGKYMLAYGTVHNVAEKLLDGMAVTTYGPETQENNEIRRSPNKKKSILL